METDFDNRQIPVGQARFLFMNWGGPFRVSR